MATLFLPYLDQISTHTAWLILCSFALIICICLSRLLHQFKHHLSTETVASSTEIPLNALFYSLLIAYSSSAFAYIPHSLFWIDYLQHTLKLNFFWINFNWILYGLGSALGAFTAYVLARKFGNFNALKILYSLYIVAIFIATLATHPMLTLTSSFFTGMLNPAVVFLTSYTILQLYGIAYKKLWSIATLCFASVQLIGGLSFSALQHFGVSYHQQFLLASFILLLGTLQLIWMTRKKQN